MRAAIEVWHDGKAEAEQSHRTVATKGRIELEVLAYTLRETWVRFRSEVVGTETQWLFHHKYDIWRVWRPLLRPIATHANYLGGCLKTLADLICEFDWHVQDQLQ